MRRMAILCRRKHDSSSVVIKELFTSAMTDDEKESSLNEIKVLTILRHPNIIAYYDSFTVTGSMEESDDIGGGVGRKPTDKKKLAVPEVSRKPSKKEKLPSTLMIVMEYADGGTLSDYLEGLDPLNQTLGLDEIMNLFCQISLALHHIHSLNILHRDLKTNNILMSGSGKYKVLKIGDFGISKIMSTKTKAETVVGTPAYISPELCEGKPYNEKSDIWALGCVLYEIVTLKKMFSAHNLPALVLKILKGVYDPIPTTFPSKLADLIKSCVELEPAMRPFMPDIIGKPFMQEYLIQTIMGVGRIAGAEPLLSESMPGLGGVSASGLPVLAGGTPIAG
ncbi:kinase-like domain-containing protein [Entophlyctis helioformis]|nr:kinase-like domain-containing protein [Entophlyctis helioformis]